MFVSTLYRYFYVWLCQYKYYYSFLFLFLILHSYGRQICSRLELIWPFFPFPLLFYSCDPAPLSPFLSLFFYSAAMLNITFYFVRRARIFSISLLNFTEVPWLKSCAILDFLPSMPPVNITALVMSIKKHHYFHKVFLKQIMTFLLVSEDWTDCSGTAEGKTESWAKLLTPYRHLSIFCLFLS